MPVYQSNSEQRRLSNSAKLQGLASAVDLLDGPAELVRATGIACASCFITVLRVVSIIVSIFFFLGLEGLVIFLAPVSWHFSEGAGVPPDEAPRLASLAFLRQHLPQESERERERERAGGTLLSVEKKKKREHSSIRES